MGHGFKSGGGGGGASLNFKILDGITQPTNTRENTIWVNTAEGITGYSFSATEPENPAEGMLWIENGTTSTVAFNAIKKESIMVYPLSAKQYVSGEWISLGAYIYQDGEWVQFSSEWSGELFDNGDQFATVTGGWVHSGGDAIGTTLNGSGGGATTFGSNVYTANAIDVTNYNTLCINFNHINYRATIAVSTDTNFGSNVDYTRCESAGIHTMDISGVTGSVHVLILAGTGAGSSFTADKVWLE